MGSDLSRTSLLVFLSHAPHSLEDELTFIPAMASVMTVNDGRRITRTVAPSRTCSIIAGGEEEGDGKIRGGGEEIAYGDGEGRSEDGWNEGGQRRGAYGEGEGWVGGVREGGEGDHMGMGGGRE